MADHCPRRQRYRITTTEIATRTKMMWSSTLALRRSWESRPRSPCLPGRTKSSTPCSTAPTVFATAVPIPPRHRTWSKSTSRMLTDEPSRTSFAIWTVEKWNFARGWPLGRHSMRPWNTSAMDWSRPVQSTWPDNSIPTTCCRYTDGHVFMLRQRLLMIPRSSQALLLWTRSITTMSIHLIRRLR